MPQTPKNKLEVPPADKKPEKDGTWGEDQEKRGYYYDDAHGYETYEPESETDSDDDLSA